MGGRGRRRRKMEQLEQLLADKISKYKYLYDPSTSITKNNAHNTYTITCTTQKHNSALNLEPLFFLKLYVLLCVFLKFSHAVCR